MATVVFYVAGLPFTENGVLAIYNEVFYFSTVGLYFAMCMAIFEKLAQEAL